MRALRPPSFATPSALLLLMVLAAPWAQAQPADPPQGARAMVTAQPAAVGHYGDIFERNLGKGSALNLERGLNANQVNGGLILSPFLD